jgi:hypothetical protein
MMNPEANISLDGVLLDEKWLLRLGGEMIEDGFDSDEGGKVCVVDFGVYRVSWSAKFNYWRVYRKMTKEYESIEDLFIAKVVFVHDWQNLFFALTGKELELKDK